MSTEAFKENQVRRVDRSKRMLLTTLGWAGLASACGQAAPGPDAALKRKFRDIGGVVLRFDATSEKRGLTITADNDRRIASPAALSRGSINLSYSSKDLPIPKTIRVVWREGAKPALGAGGINWEGGTIVGDYTIPVAERIPDDVIEAARKHKAALRIKVRVTDHGVLLGWDLEQSVPIPGKDYTNCRQRGDCVRALQWHTAGGDFKEARVFNGKVVERGWTIGPDGRKFETDF